MAEHAGRTFKHADLRMANGGSRPAGQKANKQRVITATELHAMMREKHRLQSLKIQAKKEKEFGIKKRPMPSREPQNLVEQIELLRAREAARLRWEEEGQDEDEDEEDGDYQGSDEDGNIENDEEEEVQYSGEEDAAVGDEDERLPSEDGTEADDQENQPLLDDDVVETEKGQSSPKKAVQPTSPLPENTPRPSREPLTEVRLGQTDGTPRELASTFVDISGFGSGGGSPGFSQLFEATQAAGSGIVSFDLSIIPPIADAQDAFAGLRDQGAGLLPTNALLPQVDITATQIERDNAMIAAETEGDLELEDERPKTQYMNDRG
jgi:hypothetical protein